MSSQQHRGEEQSTTVHQRTLTVREHTDSGQVAVPSEIVDKLDGPGAVVFIERDNEVVLMPLADVFDLDDY